MRLKKLFKNRFVIVFLSVLCAYPASKLPENLTVATSNSVQYRLFWTLDYTENSVIEKDMYIRAKVSKDLPGSDCSPCQIVKRVGCASGSKIESIGKDFFCDAELIGSSYKDTFVNVSATIGNDEIFLIGDHPRSYDSRYFGLIKKEEINAILQPLF